MIATEIPSWFEPDCVIWSSPDQKKEYRKVVAGKAYHLVRQVDAFMPSIPEPETFDDFSQIVDITELQFKLLGKCGILTPNIEWYAHQRRQSGIIQLIARVAIIDGVDMSLQKGTPEYARCWQQIDEYDSLTTAETRLWDLHPNQCVTGSPRGFIADEFGDYMVDIEPRLGW